MIFNENGIVVSSSSILAISEKRLSSLIEQDMMEINNIFQYTVLNEGFDIKAKISQIIEKIKAAGKWIVQKVKDLISKIKQKFDPVINKIKVNKNKIQKKFDSMSKNEKKNIMEISESFQALNESLSGDNFTNQFLEFIEKLSERHCGRINSIDGIPDDYKSYIKDMYINIGRKTNHLADVASSLKYDLFNSGDAQFTDLFNMATSGVSLIETINKKSNECIDRIFKTVAYIKPENYDNTANIDRYISYSGMITNYIAQQTAFAVETINYCINKSTRILNKIMQQDVSQAISEDNDEENL